MSPLSVLLNVIFFSNHYEEIIEGIGHVSWILEFFFIHKEGGNLFHTSYFPCLFHYNVLHCFYFLISFYCKYILMLLLGSFYNFFMVLQYLI